MRIFLVCLLVMPACAFAAEKPSLAVAEFMEVGASKGSGRQVVGPLMAELADCPDFGLIERPLIGEVLCEQGLQMSALADESSAVQLGRISGAQFLLTGQVIKLESGFQIEARVIDVSTGKVLPGRAGVVMCRSMACFTASRYLDLLHQMKLTAKGTEYVGFKEPDVEAKFIELQKKFQGPKRRVAVVDFKSRGSLGEDAGGIVADLFMHGLSTQYFDIFEREQLQKLVEEQKLQMTDLIDDSKVAARYGKLWGVDTLILGSVGKLGNIHMITARTVNCETGKVGRKAHYMAKSIEELTTSGIEALLCKMELSAREYEALIIQQQLIIYAGSLIPNNNAVLKPKVTELAQGGFNVERFDMEYTWATPKYQGNITYDIEIEGLNYTGHDLFKTEGNVLAVHVDGQYSERNGKGSKKRELKWDISRKKWRIKALCKENNMSIIGDWTPWQTISVCRFSRH